MGKIEKIMYKDHEIIYFNLQNCKEDEMIKLIYEGQDLILKENKKTTNLTNITGSFALPKVIDASINIAKNTKHLVTKDAFVGISGAKKVLITAYNLAMGGNVKAFDTEEEAKEWLIK